MATPRAITDMQLTAVRTLTGILAAPQLQASVSGSTATLSWTPPIPTGQSVIAGYRLYKGPTAGGPFTLITTTTATSLPDTLPGTQFYRVEAFDQYQTGNTSAVVGCSPATGQPVKWHPGHYMGSNNINGSVTRGNGRNQNEMNILAASGPNVLGYQTIYTWDVCELSDGGYDFANIIEDFNYLQSVAPGKRFGPMIWCEKFSGTGATGLGTPAYILNNSIYGPGSDGVHFGYWNQDFGAGQSGACAAIWRTNVNDRYTRMFEHLATTSFVTTSGPYAGQTFTFDTHPLIEFIFNQETSLNLQAGSDYNSTNFANNFNTQVNRMVAAFPHTLVGPQINFVIANALTINGIVDNLAVAGPAVAMSSPDVYPTAAGGFPTIAQNVYMGNRWNGSGFTPGGTDYRNSIPCIGFAQQATYTHFPTKGPADNFASAQTLRCSYFLWTYVSGTNYDWSSKIVPFINANPITNTAYPANFPVSSGPVPAAPQSIKLYSDLTPTTLYAICDMPAPNGGPQITQLEGLLSPSGITGVQPRFTPAANNGIDMQSCRVDFYNVPAGIAQTVQIRARNSNGAGNYSAASNSVSASAFTDTWTDGANMHVVQCGGSQVGLSSLWHDGYFDFQVVRYVDPGAATVNSQVPSRVAPAYPTGFGFTNQHMVECSPQTAGQGFGLLVNILLQNPALGSNGIFNLGPYSRFVFFVFPVGGAILMGPTETTYNIEGVVSAVNAVTGALTFANQTFGTNTLIGTSTGMFNRDTGGSSGYTSSGGTQIVSNNIAGLQVSAGNRVLTQEGDVLVGNNVGDCAPYVTWPTPGVMTQNAWNQVALSLGPSAMNALAFNNHMHYKWAIASDHLFYALKTGFAA
jgi:hypothetical protein